MLPANAPAGAASTATTTLRLFRHDWRAATCYASSGFENVRPFGKVA